MGAVEYLKAHGLDGTLITRVSTGEHVRGDDLMTLAQDEAEQAVGSQQFGQHTLSS